jgi:glycosyltransferase involved in cell wall biosynthesis
MGSVAGALADRRVPARLAVIGSPAHWVGGDGAPRSYEPYVREMRIWADLFESVDVWGPSGEGPARDNLAPYERPNVSWHPIAYPGRGGLSGKLARLAHLPAMAATVWSAVRGADFVLLRSPTHFSLVGSLAVRLLRKPSLTKWAGLNAPFPGELWTEKLQRRLEGLSSRRNLVLVYGRETRRNHVSFIPALMSLDELRRAAELGGDRRPPPPWEILSVGRLYWDKGFDLALRGLAALCRRRPEIAWRYTLVGSGPEESALRSLAEQSGIADRVEFTGALPFDSVQKRYATSHVVVMPGVMEGWPKVVAEAWAHGAYPVAANAGLASWILREPGSGLLFSATPDGLAAALERVLDGRETVAPAELRIGMARRLSLESFRDGIAALLKERFGLRPAGGA